MPVTLPETIVRRRCAALIPYARNARTHSDQQGAQIAASIREFGFTNPVLIDEEDGIIAGHGRENPGERVQGPCARSTAGWAGTRSARGPFRHARKVGPIPTMRQFR